MPFVAALLASWHRGTIRAKMASPLRRVFGPSQREIWQQLSGDIGGHVIERWNGDKLQAKHGDWTVTLDTSTVPAGKTFLTFTRMRAPYVNPEGFRFTIYRRSLFSGIATALGMQDIEIGHPPFDADFVIKGTHEGRVRELFADTHIRELIALQRDIHLTVKDDEGWCGADFPEGADELLFAVPGVIKDVERLTQLYELFGALLDRLCAIGSAYDHDPRVAL